MTMTETQEKSVEKIRETLSDLDLERATQFTLADAIREGSSVTTKEEGWGDGERACSLHAAALSVKARGYSS